MVVLFIPLLFRERVVDVGRAGKQLAGEARHSTLREKAGVKLPFLCPPSSLPSKESNQNASHFAVGEEGKED